MRKRLTKFFVAVILMLCVAALLGCGGVWFDDNRSDNPDYHYVGEGDERHAVTFVLELRQPSDETEKADNGFSHSKLDGELIESWEIPVYGNTLYESVKKFFEERDESFSFGVNQHKFYMFRECTLSDGTTYKLDTVYIAIDGEYAYCANYQSLLGDDGIAGTEDDAKTVILVYKGWLY